jgi:hypothetical protein
MNEALRELILSAPTLRLDVQETIGSSNTEEPVQYTIFTDRHGDCYCVIASLN